MGAQQRCSVGESVVAQYHPPSTMVSFNTAFVGIRITNHCSKRLHSASQHVAHPALYRGHTWIACAQVPPPFHLVAEFPAGSSIKHTVPFSIHHGWIVDRYK